MKTFYLSLLFLVSLHFGSVAQDSTAQATEENSIKALTIGEITNQYKEDYLYLDRLAETIPSDEQIKEASAEFTPKIKKLEKELEKVELGVENSDNSSMLRSCISRINTLEKKLNTGTTRLVAKNEEYYEVLQVLNKKAEVWELTKKNMSKESTPDSFIKQINKLQKQIDDISKTLNDRRLHTMDISADFSEITLRISRIKEKAENKKEVLDQNIRSKTQKDITNIKFSPTLKEQLRDMEVHIGNFASELSLFVSNWSGDIFFWLVICICTISIIAPTIIKKRKSPNLESEEMLIKHPFASLSLVVIALAFLLLKDMPSIVADIVRVLALIPILHLMHKHLPKGMYKLLVLRTFLLIFLFVCINASQEYAIGRLSMIIVIIAEPLMLYPIAKTIDKSEYLSGKTKTYTLFVCAVFGAMSLVALFSAILGYVMLAERIMSTIYNSIYLALALFILLRVLRVYAIGFLESKFGSKIKTLSSNRDVIISKLQSFAKVIAIIIWVAVFLIGIGIYSDVHDILTNMLDKGFNIGNIRLSIKMIIGFALTIYLTIIISSLIQKTLADDVLNHAKISRGISYTISILIKYALLTIGFLIALGLLGIEFGDMAIIISAFGVGIGFGLQSIFSNLVSGLILLFERPIQKGDTIEVGSLIGTVTDIGIRSSKVHTVEGAEVIVPNSNLITNEVVNWTLSDRKRRIEIMVGVSYDSNPHQVKDLIMEILEHKNGILKYPEPVILFHEMADSSLNFRVLFWTDKYEEWVNIKSDITFAIFDTLGENNIEIPFPQQDLHIRSGLDILKSEIQSGK